MRNPYLNFLLACCSLVSPSSAVTKQQHRLDISLAESIDVRLGQIVTAGELDVYLSGDLADGDTARFLAFVREHRLETANVVFNSRGGSLLEGVKLGRAIRSLGFNTSIGAKRDRAENFQSSVANCASACAYAFAGGVLRFMSGDRTRLGLHQFRSADGSIKESDAQAISGVLVNYLLEMGVDANAFALASVSPSNDMVWLDATQAEALGFVNNGIQPTQAEIKIVDMRPYLKLSQLKPGVGLQVIFLCTEDTVSLLAGIVTSEQQSRDWIDGNWIKRSYLEMDGQEAFVQPGTSGVQLNGNTVWLEKSLKKEAVSHLLKVSKVGIWLDGFGAVRAGGEIDLRGVKENIRDYLGQCARG